MASPEVPKVRKIAISLGVFGLPAGGISPDSSPAAGEPCPVSAALTSAGQATVLNKITRSNRRMTGESTEIHRAKFMGWGVMKPLLRSSNCKNANLGAGRAV